MGINIITLFDLEEDINEKKDSNNLKDKNEDKKKEDNN